MTRMHPVSPDKATGEVKTIFDDLKKKMGKVINIFQNMGNSPAVLKSYFSMSEALTHTSLDQKLREQIMLAVSQANQCDYCLAAHTTISKVAGIPDQEILLARKAEAKDPKTQAILKFAKQVVDKKGHVSDQEVATLKATGVNDKEFAEIFLAILVGMFTNYFNLMTGTQVDFPEAPKL
jgi:uncharacterized peroxidase-related enzyme